MTSRKTWMQIFDADFQSNFSDKQITQFNDGNGYSLIDEYPSRYKKQMGLQDNVKLKPFFKYYFDTDKSINDGAYVPLVINVTSTTEVHEDGVNRYMLNDARLKRMKPVDLTSSEDFYVQIGDGSVYRLYKNKFRKISLKEVHKRIFRLHISDWRTPKGAWTRLKLLVTRRISSGFFTMISWLAGWVFFLIKSKRYKYDVIRERYLTERSDSTNQGTPSSTPPPGINFFGYEVSVWTLFTYSLVVLVVDYLFSGSINAFLDKGGTLSSIITIALAITTIVLYDKIIPIILRWVVKMTSIQAFDLRYKGVKLKV